MLREVGEKGVEVFGVTVMCKAKSLLDGDDTRAEFLEQLVAAVKSKNVVVILGRRVGVGR
jgi:hypothetical protein